MTKEWLPLILITGATATGKTEQAIRIATHLNKEGLSAEVVNADSLLFYKELNIGTAKPTKEERSRVIHHLIDIKSITSPMNASDYCEQVVPLIEKLHQNKKVPIIVGGSAFYIRALLKGMYETSTLEEKDLTQIRERYRALEEQHGWQAVRERLKTVDPSSFATIHENDRYRTLRALEYFDSHNQPISQQKEIMDDFGPYDFGQLRNPDWHLHHIYLDIPKDHHWSIMEERAKAMIKKGLLQEVTEIINQGHDSRLKPLQSIGYKECFEVLANSEGLKNQLSDKETQELSERIYINTRRLAKSQKTFFKKITPKKTYNPLTDSDKIINDLKDFLKV